MLVNLKNVTLKKAALKAKYPQVFTGLEKLKIFQLKLHKDERVTPVAQAMRRIPFMISNEQQTQLEELELLDVIKNVDGPTSWINPLVCICLDIRQANRTILSEKHPVPTTESFRGKSILQFRFEHGISSSRACSGDKHLLFCVNMATEKIPTTHLPGDQRLLWCSLYSIFRAAGASEEEHDGRLIQVMKKL